MQFGDRTHVWAPWAESDDVGDFQAHFSAFYPRPEPSIPDPPESWLSRVLGCCRRRSNSLVLFVTADDFARMVGSGCRAREEADACFARWRANVRRPRRWGTPECPSVSVEVDGVEVPRD